jgi:hypothetical protein
MMMQTTITPNAPEGTANDTSAVPTLDSIASKMAAMRNQVPATNDTATGPAESKAEAASPVVPDDESAVLEDETDLGLDSEVATEEDVALDDPVSEPDSESSSEELIDFIEFAETNPNAKFKFVRNGKEVVIDAKKAAAILGQGGAIHEEARQLKVERSEFDEYLKETRERQEGLTLAMEFTVQPQLQKAYDEIVKTQNYQTTFQQQLAATQDPGQQARIEASMRQNEQYIRQQQQVIGQLKPAVDQFRDIRKQQVSQVLEANRKQFKDKELRNEFVYNELREKVSKIWPEARAEIIPGIPNIDLISSDENLMALVRDGLKYRSKPSTKQAGSSIAQLTQRRGNTQSGKNPDGELSKLREQAKAGDKKAGDNLLMQRLSQIRSASRGGR